MSDVSLPAESAPVTLAPLADTPATRQAVGELFAAAPDYFANVRGGPARAADVEDFFTGHPPGTTLEQRRSLGVYRGARLIGCVDLLVDYPQPNTTCLGLLLISKDHRYGGIGTQAYQQTEHFALHHTHATAIRIGVVATNAVVLPFWHKQGFTETGAQTPYAAGTITSHIITLEKHLL